MGTVHNIFPANDFKVVLDNASEELECGIVIGYDKDGKLTVYGGGLIDGKEPMAKDWLWLIETFKTKLVSGDYHDGG